MKNWFKGLLLLLPSLIRADFIETTDIKDVDSHVEEGSVVFLGMADTISDSTLSLGSKPWRQYIRKNVRKIQDLEQAGNIHDQWTFYVATSVPVKPVQKEMAQWIDILQKKEIPVFCLTGRGRSMWYATIIDKVDNFTDFQLRTLGIDFKKSQVPEEFKQIDPTLFHHGVFYTDPYTKGDFIDKIILETGFKPKKIIVIDDQWKQLQLIEEKLIDAGIDYLCVLYQRAEKERKNFNPVASLLQLESLFEKGFPMTEEEAIKKAKQGNISPSLLFKKLVEKYGNGL